MSNPDPASEPGLVTAFGMLTWAQHAITHSAYRPTGEPE